MNNVRMLLLDSHPYRIEWEGYESDLVSQQEEQIKEAQDGGPATVSNGIRREQSNEPLVRCRIQLLVKPVKLPHYKTVDKYQVVANERGSM